MFLRSPPPLLFHGLRQGPFFISRLELLALVKLIQDRSTDEIRGSLSAVLLGFQIALRMAAKERLEELRRWSSDNGIRLIEAADDRDRWDASVARLGADRERRCRACYALRLAEACRVAEREGFSHIATTLAVSPYQLFDTCNDVLEKLASAHGLTPVIRDFRPWYPQATVRSRELGMYRQNYCGCRFSAAEAALDRARMRDERKAEKARRAALKD